jgi:hypothetical protein
MKGIFPSCGSQQLPKSVHFASPERLCEYSSGKQRRSTRSQWYQLSDYVKFRDISKADSEIAISLGFDDFLFRAYTCRGDARAEDVKVQQKSLDLWAQSSDSRRGLEKFICKRYYSYKVIHRSKLVEAVLSTQDLVRFDKVECDRATAIIAQVAKGFSNHAVHLANSLGKADRCAAQSIWCEQHRQPLHQQPLPKLQRMLPSSPEPVSGRSSPMCVASYRPPLPPSPQKIVRMAKSELIPELEASECLQRQALVPSSSKARLERKQRVPLSPARRLEQELQQKLESRERRPVWVAAVQ